MTAMIQKGIKQDSRKPRKSSASLHMFRIEFHPNTDCAGEESFIYK